MANCVPHAPVRVLLVEDSLPVRQRIRSLIEESGTAEVVGEAGSVPNAIAQFRDQQPDVVVLDLHLEQGDGYTVLAEIKRVRPVCVVIVLTSFSAPEDRTRCLRAGANFFFDKTMEFGRVPEVLGRIAPLTQRADPLRGLGP